MEVAMGYRIEYFVKSDLEGDEVVRMVAQKMDAFLVNHPNIHLVSVKTDLVVLPYAGETWYTYSALVVYEAIDDVVHRKES
jgi:hypothetical protein